MKLKNTYPILLFFYCILFHFFSCQERMVTRHSWLYEIENLNTPEEIDAYWKKIKNLDQSKRGKNSSDSLDNENFKKVLAMIKNHGHPKNNIPHIIFTHQSSCEVMEYYFPIFHKGFLAGKADTFWFLHNVRGMYRCRYARDCGDLTSENYLKVLKQLDEVVLSNQLSFDIENVDSLYQETMNNINSITAAPIIESWMNVSKDIYNLHIVNEQFYLHKIWRDKSYGYPQKISKDTSNTRFYFQNSMDKIHFRLDSLNNLCIYDGETEKSKYWPVEK